MQTLAQYPPDFDDGIQDLSLRQVNLPEHPEPALPLPVPDVQVHELLRVVGDNDGDDEIQIIAQQNTRASNHKPPGHKRAHKPQVTK